MRTERRAFSLIELLLGLTVSIIVITAISVVFTDTMRNQRLQRARAQLARDGAAFGHQFTQEARLTSMGRPPGQRVTLDLTTRPSGVLTALATTTGFAFMTDVARPDANHSTFGLLDDHPTGGATVSFHTDNNGSCTPSTSSTPCSTAVTSPLFAGETSGLCNSAASSRDRSCPWGQKRLRPGEPLQIVAGNGEYANVRADTALAAIASTNVAGDKTIALKLSNYPATWPNTALGDAPVDVRGQGWVTTQDRVFYRYCNGNIDGTGGTVCGGTRTSAEKRVIERRQCWGAVLPENARWPSTRLTDATLRGALDPAIEAGTCTPWEVVLRHVDSAEFVVDTGDTGLAASVKFNIKLKRRTGTLASSDVGHAILGSVQLRNSR
jgi:type II secretory pathway pseudopilin PulG